MNDLRNQTALELGLTAAGPLHRGGLRHDELNVTEEQIRGWLADAGFFELVETVFAMVGRLRTKLEAAGLSADLIDGELRAQVTEWGLTASLIAAPPAPEAQSFQGVRPSTRRAWALEKLTDV